MQKLQSFDDLDLDSPTEEWRNNEHFAANIDSILRPGTAVVTHVQMAWHPQGKSAGSSCASPRQVVLSCCFGAGGCTISAEQPHLLYAWDTLLKALVTAASGTHLLQGSG